MDDQVAATMERNDAVEKVNKASSEIALICSCLRLKGDDLNIQELLKFVPHSLGMLLNFVDSKHGDLDQGQRHIVMDVSQAWFAPLQSKLALWTTPVRDAELLPMAGNDASKRFRLGAGSGANTDKRYLIRLGQLVRMVDAADLSRFQKRPVIPVRDACWAHSNPFRLIRGMVDVTHSYHVGRKFTNAQIHGFELHSDWHRRVEGWRFQALSDTEHRDPKAVMRQWRDKVKALVISVGKDQLHVRTLNNSTDSINTQLAVAARTSLLEGGVQAREPLWTVGGRSDFNNMPIVVWVKFDKREIDTDNAHYHEPVVAGSVSPAPKRRAPRFQQPPPQQQPAGSGGVTWVQTAWPVPMTFCQPMEWDFPQPAQQQNQQWQARQQLDQQWQHWHHQQWQDRQWQEPQQQAHREQHLDPLDEHNQSAPPGIFDSQSAPPAVVGGAPGGKRRQHEMRDTRSYTPTDNSFE